MESENEIRLAIDASRSRSGGARAHIIGILAGGDPRVHGIAQIHIWGYQALLSELPEFPWLYKHSPPELAGSLLMQVWWQRFRLSREMCQAGCNVLLSTDAGSLCRFVPAVVMSRDMLSFEPGEMHRYSVFSFQRWRLHLLKSLQTWSLRRSAGALFLTGYACLMLQRYTGNLRLSRIIPHGISDAFRIERFRKNELRTQDPIKCLYISNAELYKHQWNVVRAISELRREGYNVTIDLVGATQGAGCELLTRTIAEVDPHRTFVRIMDPVPHSHVASFLAEADIFIFASSCENMPNTLVEAMAAGLPIACSDRGPMPEVLQDAGIYFDPEDVRSIEKAVRLLLNDVVKREELGIKAAELSTQYSWRRCAKETWQFVADVFREQPIQRELQ